MKEQYVSFEQAKRLKVLGFCEKVSHYYCKFPDGEIKLWDVSPPEDHNARVLNKEICSAPRLDQAQAWLREKGIDIEPRVYIIGKSREYRPYVMPPRKTDYIASPSYPTYDLALSAGIDEALKLLEKGDRQ